MENKSSKPLLLFQKMIITKKISLTHSRSIELVSITGFDNLNFDKAIQRACNDIAFDFTNESKNEIEHLSDMYCNPTVNPHYKINNH